MTTTIVRNPSILAQAPHLLARWQPKNAQPAPSPEPARRESGLATIRGLPAGTTHAGRTYRKALRAAEEAAWEAGVRHLRGTRRAGAAVEPSRPQVLWPRRARAEGVVQSVISMVAAAALVYASVVSLGFVGEWDRFLELVRRLIGG